MKWIKFADQFLKEIKENKSEDRLSYLNALGKNNLAAAYIIKNWTEVFMNPELMVLFSEEQIKELYEGFTSLVLKFLRHKLVWVSKITEMTGEKPLGKTESYIT